MSATTDRHTETEHQEEVDPSHTEYLVRIRQPHRPSSSHSHAEQLVGISEVPHIEGLVKIGQNSYPAY
jgi:hypothetical protein